MRIERNDIEQVKILKDLGGILTNKDYLKNDIQKVVSKTERIYKSTKISFIIHVKMPPEENENHGKQMRDN